MSDFQQEGRKNGRLDGWSDRMVVIGIKRYQEEGKKMKLILSTIHDGLTMRWEFEIITGDDDDLSHHVQSNIADES